MAVTERERTLAWMGAVVLGLLSCAALGFMLLPGGDDTAGDGVGTDEVAAPFVADRAAVPTVPAGSTPSTAPSEVGRSVLVVDGIEAEMASAANVVSSTSTTAAPAMAAPTTSTAATALATTSTTLATTSTTLATTSTTLATTSTTLATTSTTLATTATTGSGQSGDRALEQRVIELTNAERQKHGCPPLAGHDRLHAAALGHSTDMANNGYFSHTSLDGSSLRDRIDRQGYSWRSITENIATGYRTPESVVDGWMNSPGHRANILNCDLTEIGVGHDRTYWTQNFGTPR